MLNASVFDKKIEKAVLQSKTSYKKSFFKIIVHLEIVQLLSLDLFSKFL